MNSSLTTLERPASLLAVSPLLAQHGFTCTLLTFPPDSETLLPASPSPDDQLLFVVDGDMAVHREGLTTIVNRHGALLFKADRPATVSTRAGGPTRVLRVEIPLRQIVTPQLLTPRA